jgi:hypothetical protein
MKFQTQLKKTKDTGITGGNHQTRLISVKKPHAIYNILLTQTSSHKIAARRISFIERKERNLSTKSFSTSNSRRCFSFKFSPLFSPLFHHQTKSFIYRFWGTKFLCHISFSIFVNHPTPKGGGFLVQRRPSW